MNKKLMNGIAAFVTGCVMAKIVKTVIDKRKEERVEYELQD